MEDYFPKFHSVRVRARSVGTRVLQLANFFRLFLADTTDICTFAAQQTN